MKDNDIAKRDVSVPKGFPRMRCYAAAIIAVIAGAGVLFILTRKGESVHEDNSDHKIGLISDVNPYGGKAQTASLQTPSNVPLAKLKKPHVPVGNVITAQANVGRVETLMDGSVVTDRCEVIFKRPFERGLQVALRPGGFGASAIMKLQYKYDEGQILQMLKEITRPEPDDSDEVAFVKNNVQKLKEDLLLKIQSGRTVNEVLDELRRQCATERNLKVEVDRINREAQRTGDAKLIRDTVRKTNQLLSKNGIAENAMPPVYRKKIAEIESAEREAQKIQNEQDADALKNVIEDSIK